MTIDDRLRDAHRRNLEQVEDRVFEDRVSRVGAATGAGVERRSTGPHRPARLIGLAVAAVMVAVAGFGLFRLIGSIGGTATEVETDAAGGEPGEAEADRPTVVIPADPPAEAVTDPEPVTGSGADAGSAPDRAVSTTEASTGEPSAAEPTREPSTTSSPTLLPSASPTSLPSASPPPDRPEPGPGAATDVCPSGARAELERAELIYVGESRGWGRKDDLVNEQDGPFFFQAWEPNHERPVTVEIRLDRPVAATDLRVHQDPFTPVSGVITIELGATDPASGPDQAPPIEIELSGTDGWRVHTFDAPTVIERFTIRRERAETNIMEVMVCVDPAGS